MPQICLSPPRGPSWMGFSPLASVPGIVELAKRLYCFSWSFHPSLLERPTMSL